MSLPRSTTAWLPLLLLAGSVSFWGGCASTAPPGQETEPSPSRVTPLAPPGSADDLGSTKEEYARRHFIRGLTRIRLGDSAAAATHFKQALEATPEAPAILSALADAQAAQGDLSTALYHARLARAARPSTVHYHRQVAQLYRQAEQPEKALRAYEQLLERFPADTEARLSLARLRAETGRPAEALRAYQALAERSAPSPALLAEMLALYRTLDDPGGIERTLKALIRQEPLENEHRRALARFYQQQGRAQAALPLLEEALERHPSDAHAAALLAEAYRSAGRPADAAALKNRTATGPADATADQAATADQLAERARPLYRRATSGRTDSADVRSAAVRLLEKALAKDPAHADALAMLGRLRLQAGAFAEAADLLNRSLEANPRHPKRWRYAAEALLKGGQPNRAAAVADEGLLLFPGQLPLLRLHATALMRTDQAEAAMRQFEEALRIMKADGLLDTDEHAGQAARFHTALGRLYDRQGLETQADHHYERALPLARRATQYTPEDPAALSTLGTVLFERGLLAEAQRVLRAALDTGAAGAAVYKRYGDVAAARGQPQEARSYWQQALERGYESNALREKLGTVSN